MVRRAKAATLLLSFRLAP